MCLFSLRNTVCITRVVLVLVLCKEHTGTILQHHILLYVLVYFTIHNMYIRTLKWNIVSTVLV